MELHPGTNVRKLKLRDSAPSEAYELHVYDEYDEGRWFLMAIQKALRDGHFTIRHDERLDREGIQLILEAARERVTVREAVSRLIAFLEANELLEGSLPASFPDKVESVFAMLRPSRQS